jgi:hypothetical protein
LLLSWLESPRQWSNDNAGFLALLLFLVTVALGWASGVFRSLRRRPLLRLDVNPGPTFACTFGTGNQYKGHEAHRTAFCIYLAITNRGTAPTDIIEVTLGYHNYTPKYTFLWCWLEHQTVALADFQVSLGEHTKIYPFLTQMNQLLPTTPDTYLQEGRQTRGVVYFEQLEAWGGWLPRVKARETKVKVRVMDAYGRQHSEVFRIPIVTLEDARKYNPLFGATFDALQSARQQPEQADA